MKGHFNGSELSTLSNENARKLFKSYFPSSASGWGVSASVVVPSLKHDDNMTTVTQSLNRFIDAMTAKNTPHLSSQNLFVNDS